MRTLKKTKKKNQRYSHGKPQDSGFVFVTVILAILCAAAVVYHIIWAIVALL